MKVKNFVHHIIEVKSGRHTMVDYQRELGMKPINWISILHGFSQSDWDDFLWGYDYEESMIGNNRSLTKEEYKLMMHNIRHNDWEFDKTRDNAYSDEYQPDYNPGGGPYELES